MKNNRVVYLMLMIVLLMKIAKGQEVIYADIEREGSEIVPKLCHQSYTVQVIKRYELSEEVINELMPRDLYNLRTIRKTYRERFDFDERGEMVYTIEHGASTNYYPEWMDQPQYTVITKQGVTVVRNKPNSQGDVEVHIPHTPEEALFFEQIARATSLFGNKIMIPPDPDALSESGEWEERVDGSFEYKYIREGISGSIVFSPGGYLHTMIEDTVCGRRITKTYGYGVSDADVMVLLSVREEQEIELGGGYGATRVYEEEYSNWSLERCDGKPIQLRGGNGGGILGRVRMYPNPVRDELYLEVPDGWKDIEIVVHDINGRPLEVQSMKRGGIVNIDISRLRREGLYFVKIFSNVGAKTFIFMRK